MSPKFIRLEGSFLRADQIQSISPFKRFEDPSYSYAFMVGMINQSTFNSSFYNTREERNDAIGYFLNELEDK